MKKCQRGFTLIELLVVTVVIVTLMGIVFRLAGMGSESRARAITIKRMQRLENCLSGYYAAYGSYPPVPLQGRSRSIYAKVDDFGVQNSGDIRTTKVNATPLAQIHEACRAQPVAALFPFRKERGGVSGMKEETLNEYYDGIIEARNGKRQSKYTSEFGLIKNRPKNTANWGASADGDNVQVFQFGLMSFLLPRYLFMFSGDEYFYEESQWGACNQLPCKLNDGKPFENWRDMVQYMNTSSNSKETRYNVGMIKNLTSQRVCARWMPNLEGIVTCGGSYNFYGVNITCSENFDNYLGNIPYWDAGVEVHELYIHIPNGYSSGGGSGDKYLLNCMTVRDGWHTDLYYYSDPPYQSYRLWSAGPNGKTFPPWITLDQLNSGDRATAGEWMIDDLIGLSN